MKLEPRKIELSTELGNDFIADVGISKFYDYDTKSNKRRRL